MSVRGPQSLPVRPFTPPAHTARPASRAGVGSAAAAPGAPAAPPDSSLWNLLTADEREFFSQQASLGALTYGRARGTAAPAPGSAPTGQRLDVRG